MSKNMFCTKSRNLKQKCYVVLGVINKVDFEVGGISYLPAQYMANLHLCIPMDKVFVRAE